MANLQQLAKDSAIYGLTSILGRSINYLLTPIHTYAIPAATGQYSIVTRLYAATAILMLMLSFGMETTMFRFLNKEGGDKQRTYSTIVTFIGLLTLAFIGIIVAFPNQTATIAGYPETPYYVVAIFATVALDAFQSIPLAYLRFQKRPIKFMMVYVGKIAFIVVLNFLYFIALPYLHINPFGLYDANFTIDVGFTFYINLLGSIASTIFLMKEICIARPLIDRSIFVRLFAYSWPLVLLNVAGQINKSADKLIYPYLDTTPDSAVNLSIYGSVVKIAAIMTMITQAFRYAYEPIVFAIAKDKESKEYQAQTMKYYLIFMLLAFLMVVGLMNIFRHIIAPDYWAGLYIVPITMATEITIGIYYNLSMWYKTTDKTYWGACFSITACFIYFAINIIFVPRFGYVACACAGLGAYIVAVLLSYFIGQKKNPIKYPLRDIGIYVAIATLFFVIMTWSNNHLSKWVAMGMNTVVLALFVAHIIHYDLPLSSLPVIGRYFKKS